MLQILNIENADQSALSKYHTDSSKTPEIVVLFVENTNISMSFTSQLSKLVGDAASSLIVPYFYARGSESQNMISLFKTKGYQVLESSPFPKSNIIPLTTLSEYLEKNKIIFEDNVPQLLIVHLPESATAPHLLNMFSSKINTLSSGNYLCLFTIDLLTTPISQKFDAVESDVVIMQRDSNPFYFAGGRFWPIEVWEGVLCVIVLVILAIVGVLCTAQLQTPDKWANENRYPCLFTELPDP